MRDSRTRVEIKALLEAALSKTKAERVRGRSLQYRRGVARRTRASALGPGFPV